MNYFRTFDFVERTSARKYSNKFGISLASSYLCSRKGIWMNYHGIILGLGTFLCIGVFHPIVIKCEYHFGVKCWPVFLVLGIAGCIGSLFVESIYISVLLGVFSFSCFWSILELFQQRKRVERGWFPKKEKRG